MQQRELSATIKHVHIKKVSLLGLKIGLYVLSSHTQLKSADFGVWIFFYATQKAICDESTFLFFVDGSSSTDEEDDDKMMKFPMRIEKIRFICAKAIFPPQAIDVMF